MLARYNTDPMGLEKGDRLDLRGPSPFPDQPEGAGVEPAGRLRARPFFNRPPVASYRVALVC